MRFGGGGGPANRFHGMIDDVRVYDVALSPQHAAVVATGESITEIAALPPVKRSEAQAEKITLYFLDNHAPKHVQQAWATLVASRRLKTTFADSLPTVMVMQERETPRDTFLLLRGAYDKPGEQVTPGFPRHSAALNRGCERMLGSRVVVDPSNPLTARVSVIVSVRFFRHGLVKTCDTLVAG